MQSAVAERARLLIATHRYGDALRVIGEGLGHSPHDYDLFCLKAAAHRGLDLHRASPAPFVVGGGV